MTDFKHVRDLISDNFNNGYNLIVIDPPWEMDVFVRKKRILHFPTDICCIFQFKNLLIQLELF